MRLFEIIYKPSSVLNGHLSRLSVTAKLKRLSDGQATHSHFLLHQVGFTQLSQLPAKR